MSTTPLTVVEGAMALPRSRPFNDVPAPFGRGWTLLAPCYSLDRQLHGLYRAVLETFDLSQQPIRSFCRWVAPEGRGEHAVAGMGAGSVAGEGVSRIGEGVEADALEVPWGVGAAASAASAASVGAAHLTDSVPSVDSAWVDASELADASTLAQAPVSPDACASETTHPSGVAQRAPRALFPPRWALAGGACAVSGAALLAWMAIHDGASHPRNGQGMKSAEGAVAVGNLEAVHPALRRGADSSNKAHEAVRAKPASAASATQLAHAASAPEAGRGIVVGATAGRPETAKPIETRMPAGRSITRTREQLAARKDGRRVGMRRHLAGADAVSHRRYAAVDASSLAVQTAAPRTIVKPYVAGAYLPLRPTQLGTHDYASMDMSPGVRSSGRAQSAPSAQSARLAQEVQHARDAQDAQRIQQAQQPQPPSSANPSPNNSPQWMNRLSQRRVTEVPDQFNR